MREWAEETLHSQWSRQKIQSALVSSYRVGMNVCVCVYFMQKVPTPKQQFTGKIKRERDAHTNSHQRFPMKRQFLCVVLCAKFTYQAVIFFLCGCVCVFLLPLYESNALLIKMTAPTAVTLNFCVVLMRSYEWVYDWNVQQPVSKQTFSFIPNHSQTVAIAFCHVAYNVMTDWVWTCSAIVYTLYM